MTFCGSDPWVTDSDSDGIPDAWETAFSLNPNDPADAGQASALEWAILQNLSNLQVYILYGVSS